MNTADPIDDCLSMDGPLWRRVEAWVRSQVFRDRTGEIDAEQIVNDTLRQWHQHADAVERNAAIISVTPLLRTIAACRIRDAFRFESRAKRDSSICQHSVSYEDRVDKLDSLGWIEVTDTLEVLLVRLSSIEGEVVRLRLIGHDEAEIQRMTGLTRSDLHGIQNQLMKHARPFLLEAEK